MLVAGIGLYSACSLTEETTVPDQPTPQVQQETEYIRGTVYEMIVSEEKDTSYFEIPGALVRLFDSQNFYPNQSYSADRLGNFRLPIDDLMLGETYVVEVMETEGAIGTIEFSFTEDYKEQFLERGMNLVIDQNIRTNQETSGPRDLELYFGDPRRVRID